MSDTNDRKAQMLRLLYEQRGDLNYDISRMKSQIDEMESELDRVEMAIKVLENELDEMESD